jgi:hypothetical protein
MSLNTGTLISAAIRPIDSLDPIASAYASEIKGGLHTSSNFTNRNAIIFERREWGMMCYVEDQDQTYQLRYNYSSSDIMDNNNWVVFSGSGGGGGSSEWLDSVLEIRSNPPGSPSNGDRYILSSPPSGGWSSFTASVVLTYNSSLSSWEETIPSSGSSVVVDNEENAVYQYVGVFPSGSWRKESLSQIRSLVATTPNGYDYVASSSPTFPAYIKDMVFLTKFDSFNTGITASIDINGLGSVEIRKATSTGLDYLQVMDLNPDIIYNLVYNGTYFQMTRPYVNEDIFNVKYFIESSDYIVVPQYYQYWVYSDLTIAGTLVNYGQVIIANGAMILTGSGSFVNYGGLNLINFDVGMTNSYNSSNSIIFTQSNTIYGLSVSAYLSNTGVISGTYGGSNSIPQITVDSQGRVTSATSVSLSGISYTLAGDGLISSGSNLLVNTGAGLTISNDQVDIVWGGTSSGLTFSPGNALGVLVDGSSITINSQGKLTAAAGGSSVPVYQSKYSLYNTTGDGQPTGFTLSFVPNDFSRIQIFVNGQIQIIGDGTSASVDCYFYDGVSEVSLNNLSIGDELYWNFTNSGFNLTTMDLIYVTYET